MKRTTVQLESLRTRAEVVTSSWNEEERTIEVSFASELPYRRNSWDGPFMEVLSLNNAHVRMDRLNSGAPVLNDHNRFSLEDQIGVVERAWIKDGKGYAKLKMSGRDEIAGLIKDIKEGIIRNVSVGYKVHKFEKSMGQTTEIPTMKAVDWEPFEVSFVPVPADHTVGVRSDTNTPTHECEIVTIDNMRKPFFNAGAPTDTGGGAPTEGSEQNRGANASTPASTPAPDSAPAPVDTEAVRAAERARIAGIDAVLRKLNLTDETFRNELINSNVSVEAASQRAIEKFAANDPASGQRSTQVTVGTEDRDHQRNILGLALSLKSSEIRADKEVAAGRLESSLIVEAQKYNRHSMLDVVRMALENDGVRTAGMSKHELANAAMRNMITSSTSDLPVIFEGTARRVMLAAYQAIPDTWRRIATIGSVSDFREYKRVRPGSLTSLDDVSENGEYKTKKLQDAEQEKVSVKTKGNLINVTRVMLINDDLSALTSLASDLGRAAARSIERDFYALLSLNSGNGPTMNDGNPLFHASHNNIATTAGAISASVIDANRVQMANHMDIGGNDFIDVTPSMIWLPLGLESTAKQLNESATFIGQNNSAVPNTVRGIFQDIVGTPRLAGTAYYLLADPSIHPVFEVTFLDGVQEPYMEMEEAFTQDGVSWKVRHDYGVAAIGWRGILRNAGA